MAYKCPKAGCDFETSTRWGMASHIKGHKNRGELPKDKVHFCREPTPPPAKALPKAVEIADALLLRVVEVLKSDDFKDEQLKVAKKRIIDLEHEVNQVKAENDRLLKIHNDQVKRGELTSSEELARLAKQPRLRG